MAGRGGSWAPGAAGLPHHEHLHLRLSQLRAWGGAGGLGQQGDPVVSLQLLGLTPMDLHGGEGIPAWTQKALDWLGPTPGLTSGPLVSI